MTEKAKPKPNKEVITITAKDVVVGMMIRDHFTPHSTKFYKVTLARPGTNILNTVLIKFGSVVGEYYEQYKFDCLVDWNKISAPETDIAGTPEDWMSRSIHPKDQSMISMGLAKAWSTVKKNVSPEAWDGWADVLEKGYRAKHSRGYVGIKLSGLDDLINTPEEQDLSGKGRVDNSHVTILYGFEPDTDPKTIQHLVGDFGPVVFKLGESSVFPPTDASEGCDVLKLDVESDDLHRLHDLLSKLPHKASFPEYSPHVTLAYLKPGTGEKYVGMTDASGQEHTAYVAIYKAPDGTETPLSFVERQKEVPKEDEPVPTQEEEDALVEKYKAMLMESMNEPS